MTHDQHNEINRRIAALERENAAKGRQLEENTLIIKALIERAPVNGMEIIRQMVASGELDFLDVVKLPERKIAGRKTNP